MCNYMHKDSKSIPENGTGWKIFEVFRGSLIKGAAYDVFYRREEQNKYIKWEYDKDGGFCFFLNKKLGEQSLKLWDENTNLITPKLQYVLLPIEYKGGMGKHLENGFVSKEVMIALCKEFIIADSNYKLARKRYNE